ncbi:ribosome assembly RNA-binding protein YhbY [candidate division KSB3 bacterium]|uniref:Ribosome assembly RNA-binding protein YhbY n=1 Tax=candidate division KSB3 bacterium TaxID=2044937 RepID=A0A2G6K7Q5_9BACT|nr:MAG: ribosome assembly RNA-binding protein YhbY [candidate division KSB3 bacterium]
MEKRKGSVRKYLRGLAHHLKPVVYVGQKGLTENFFGAANQALDEHELIKIKFTRFKHEKKELAKEIEQQTRSEMVGLIGNIAIFYRQHHDEEKRSIQLP